MSVGFPLGIYRPVLASPGTPGSDFAVGRTSTNTLSTGFANGVTTKTGFSSTSFTLATGAGKVFTVDTTITNAINMLATNYVQMSSTASPTNKLTATVTSLVGATLTLNVSSISGSGTFSDWQLISHLPANSSFNAAGNGGNGSILVGSSSVDVTIADWDFRSIGFGFQLTGSGFKIDFSQSLFDLRGWVGGNVNWMGSGGGTQTFSMSRCTIDGINTAVRVNRAFGSSMYLCEYCDLQNWPMDWLGIVAISGVTTNIRYNRVIITSTTDSSFGLHADGFQQTAWSDTTGVNFYNNVVVLLQPPPGGSSTSFPLNLGALTGDWNAATSIHDNIFYGGSYNLFIQQGGGFANTASISFVNNYVSGGVFGVFYTAGTTMANITVDSFKDANTGAIQTFSYIDSNSVPHNNVTSIP